MSSLNLKFPYRVLYYITLFGILFHFIAYPAYSMVTYFPYGVKSNIYYPFIRPEAKVLKTPLESETSLSRTLQKEKQKSNIIAAKNNSTYKTNKVVSNEEKVIEFISQDKSGVIGYDSKSNSDDPSDNIFSFNIEKQVLTGKEIHLSYEVYGIENVSGISRSINENNATGGYLVKKNTQWNHLEEIISADQLKNGINHLLFTAFEQKAVEYKIKNVSIKAVPTANQKLLSLADGAVVYTKNNKAYLKGYVLKEGFDLYVNNEKITIKNNEFETIVAHDSATSQLEVQLKKHDMLVYSETVKLTEAKEASVHAFKKTEAYSFINEIDDKTYGATLEEVDFKIKKESYDKVQQITVQKLRAIDLAPMGTNIINVTKNKAGYRFLPEGAKFKENAQIAVKFDKVLLPSGYDANDVKILYFDLDKRRWLSVPTDTIIADQDKVVGLTDHFTDYIAGIIKSPESPETSSFTPTSISDIQVANPTANIVQIQPPTANQQGDGTVDFPITLPTGRAGLQPNLSVSYNNNGSTGIVGQGWDISIPVISVDTRFGVPTYDPNYETESYLLNGEEIMMKGGISFDNNYFQQSHYLPHRSGSQRARGGTDVEFFPKVESSFSKIIRKGDNPSNYYWEIWDKSGTKYTYGGEIDYGSRVTMGTLGNGTDFYTSVLKSEINNPDAKRAKWFLSEVKDKNNNLINIGIELKHLHHLVL